MRGKPIHSSNPTCQVRIIPASAGQTSFRWQLPDGRKDHPRECGANEYPSSWRDVRAGSSPRVRGKPIISQIAAANARIIPASAGQTSPYIVMAALVQDHPRECGANLRTALDSLLRHGSSPRVRGKHEPLHVRVHPPRIIPASAGQTPGLRHARPWYEDHPRECGANLRQNVSLATDLGSSPRVRGKPMLVLMYLNPTRIIPASAGQTETIGLWIAVDEDHPRECGANTPPQTRHTRP